MIWVKVCRIMEIMKIESLFCFKNKFLNNFYLGFMYLLVFVKSYFGYGKGRCIKSNLEIV